MKKVKFSKRNRKGHIQKPDKNTNMQRGPVDYHNYILSKSEKNKFYILASLSLFLTGMLFYKSIIMSLLLILAIVPLKKIYTRSIAEKKRSELTVQFKDLLYSISASFSAGRHMTAALEEAQDNLILIYKKDDSIILELKYICDRIISNKESEEDVLFDFAERSGIEDIVNFMDVYFTCRTTGGDVQRVVNEASSVIADKIDMEKEINTITAQKRYEAKILTFIPVLLIAFLQFTSPDYIDPLYTTLTGRLIMTASIGMIAVAFIWSMKITGIKV